MQYMHTHLLLSFFSSPYNPVYEICIFKHSRFRLSNTFIEFDLRPFTRTFIVYAFFSDVNLKPCCHTENDSDCGAAN